MREETKGARNPNAQKSQCSGYSNKGQLSNSYIPEVGTVLEEAAKANLLRECVLELSLQPSTAVSELLTSTGHRYRGFGSTSVSGSELVMLALPSWTSRRGLSLPQSGVG